MDFSGSVQWTREESLGAVVATVMVDLPVSDQSDSIENFIMTTMDEGNPLKLGLMRLQLQFSLVKVRREKIINYCIALTVHTITAGHQSISDQITKMTLQNN